MTSVRPAVPADRPAAEAVIAAAFPAAGIEELRIARRLWADGDELPELELVALDDAGAVVGHVLCSRATVDGVEVVALGPIAVRPDLQGQGIGATLMEAVLDRVARAAEGWPLVGLLGHVTYYPRFGFVPGRTVGIRPPFELPPGQEDAFMVRPVPGRAQPTGTFRYAPAFD